MNSIFSNATSTPYSFEANTDPVQQPFSSVDEYPFFSENEDFNTTACFVPEEQFPVFVIDEPDGAESDVDSANETTTPGSNENTTISPEPFAENGNIGLSVAQPWGTHLSDLHPTLLQHRAGENQEHSESIADGRRDILRNDVAQGPVSHLDTIAYEDTPFKERNLQDHKNMTHYQDTFLYTAYRPEEDQSCVDVPVRTEAVHQLELKNLPHDQYADRKTEGTSDLNESRKNNSHVLTLADAPLEQQQHRKDGPFTVTPEVVNVNPDNEAYHMTNSTEIKSNKQLPPLVYDDVRPERGSCVAPLRALPQTSLQPLPLDSQSSNVAASRAPLAEWPTLSSPLLQSPGEGSRFARPPSCRFPAKGIPSSFSVPLSPLIPRSDELLVNPLTWNEERNHGFDEMVGGNEDRTDVAEVREGLSLEPLLSDQIFNSEEGPSSGIRGAPSPGQAIPSPSIGSMPLGCLNPREDIQDLLDMGEALGLHVDECRQGPKRRCSEERVVSTQEGSDWLDGRAKKRKRSSRSGYERSKGKGSANDHHVRSGHCVPSSGSSGLSRSCSAKAKRGRRRGICTSVGSRTCNAVVTTQCAREAVAMVPPTEPPTSMPPSLTSSTPFRAAPISVSPKSYATDMLYSAQLPRDIPQFNPLPGQACITPEQWCVHTSEPSAQQLGQNTGGRAALQLHSQVCHHQPQVSLVPYVTHNHNLCHGGSFEQFATQTHSKVGQVEAKGHCLVPIPRIEQGLSWYKPSVEVARVNAVSLTEVETPAEMRSSGGKSNAEAGRVAESQPVQVDTQLIASGPAKAHNPDIESLVENTTTEREVDVLEKNHVDIDDVLMQVASRNSVLWEETKKRKTAEEGAAKQPCAKRVRKSANQGLGSDGRSTRGSSSFLKSCYLASPSTFCHLCTRSAKNELFIICGNVVEGTCRKVACFKCLRELPQDWESLGTDSAWTCPHCRKACPSKAQCNTYHRVNRNRRTRGRRADRSN